MTGHSECIMNTSPFDDTRHLRPLLLLSIFNCLCCCLGKRFENLLSPLSKCLHTYLKITLSYTLTLYFAGWWQRTCSTLSSAASSEHVTTPPTSPDVSVVSPISTWPPSAVFWIMIYHTLSTPDALLCSTRLLCGWTSFAQAAWRHLFWRRCLTFDENCLLPSDC